MNSGMIRWMIWRRFFFVIFFLFFPPFLFLFFSSVLAPGRDVLGPNL